MQFIDIKGASANVRLLLVNSPVTVSTTVVSFVISSVICRDTIAVRALGIPIYDIEGNVSVKMRLHSKNFENSIRIV